MSGLYDLHAERTIVAALFLDNSLIDRAGEVIGAEDFHNPLLGSIFAAIVEQYAGGGDVTPMTLRSRFKADPLMLEAGGLMFLAHLTAQPPLANAEDLADRIAGLALRRRLQAVFSAAAAACSDLESTRAEIAEFVRKGIASARASRSKVK